MKAAENHAENTTELLNALNIFSPVCNLYKELNASVISIRFRQENALDSSDCFDSGAVGKLGGELAEIDGQSCER